MLFAWLSTAFACLLFCFSVAFSAPPEPIVPIVPFVSQGDAVIGVDDALIGYSFSLRDSALGRAELTAILDTDLMCRSYVRKEDRYSGLSDAATVVSATVVVYGVGLSWRRDQLQKTPLAAGALSLAANYLLSRYLQDKNLRAAVELFNRKEAGIPGAPAPHRISLQRDF